MPPKLHFLPPTRPGSFPISVFVTTATITLPAYAAQPLADVNTITVVGGVQQENAWGAVGTIVAKHSTTGTKTNTPIQKPQSFSMSIKEKIELCYKKITST